VGIDYFHLLGDGDGDAAWKPLRVAEIAGKHLDDAGVPLADLAALDAILDGTVWRSDKIDPAFGLIGLRIAPGATTPTRHHDLRRLTIVHGGELTVSTDDQTVRAGQFFVIDEGCPYSLTAGPDGVTFIETWPPKLASSLTTYWHLDAGDD
jgi:quercetin dioxygenase-like cupin family protein